jgi:hypothetical protein
VWRALVDEQGPKQASRVFAKVLARVEDLGLAEVGRIAAAALASGEPLLLALAPPRAVETLLAEDALPPRLRCVAVDTASAADYDALLGGGGQ